MRSGQGRLANTLNVFGLGAVFLFAFGCGGGPSGGNDDILFYGTITRSSTTATTVAASSLEIDPLNATRLDERAGPTTCPDTGEGIEICARESCAESSSAGDWRLSVAAYGGGDIDFSFRGCNVNATRTVKRISRNTQSVEVSFSVLSERSVRTNSACQFDREGFLVEGTTSSCNTTTSTTLASGS